MQCPGAEHGFAGCAKHPGGADQDDIAPGPRHGDVGTDATAHETPVALVVGVGSEAHQYVSHAAPTGIDGGEGELT
eukprot:8961397-Pyramimonas_sp.AAC.1